MRKVMDKIAVFSESTATFYIKGTATKFYFRFAIFSKEKKNVLIPSYLYDSKDDWNHTALTLINAMIDRTSGGYWMAQLEKYRGGELCGAIESATTTEDEKNTLRVMYMMMRMDALNNGNEDGFISSYLNHVPAKELPEDHLERLYFDRCYLTIV